MGVVGRAWARYRTRKSRKGIATDFAVLAVAIILTVGPLRRGVMTYALRCIIAQPRAYEAIAYTVAADSIEATTPRGGDTTLHFPPKRPTTLNSASLWSAQSRAEMRSLNAAAERWTGIRFYVITDEDEMADMGEYMRKKGYNSLRLLGHKRQTDGLEDADQGCGAEMGVADELLNSVPSTVVVDSEGQVIVKKLGAAKWTGQDIDRIFRQISDNKSVTGHHARQ